jgi:hypothetical protein
VNRRIRRHAALAIAGVLAVGGAGGAYAATSGSADRDALLNDAARRLNVSPEKLRSALEDAFLAQLDQAVEDGKLTRAEADRIAEHVEQGGVPLLGGPPLGGPIHVRGEVGIALDDAADYLGLSPAQLRQRLARDNSLADVARAEQKSVEGLERALLDAAEQRLDEAVDDGDLTAKQRDELLERLRDHVGELVRNVGPGPRFHHRDERGFGFGPPPPGARGHHWD